MQLNRSAIHLKLTPRTNQLYVNNLFFLMAKLINVKIDPNTSRLLIRDLALSVMFGRGQEEFGDGPTLQGLFLSISK